MITIRFGDYPVLRALFYAGLNFLHIVLTFVMFWWSMCMFWPNDLFQSSLSFHVFQEMMSKLSWAFFFLAVGVAGLIGSFNVRDEVKAVSSGVLASAHGVIALLIALSEHGSTGIGAYMALMFIGYAVTGVRTLVRIG